MQNEPVLTGVREPSQGGAAGPEPATVAGKPQAGGAAGRRVTIPVGVKACRRYAGPQSAVQARQRLVTADDEVLDSAVLHADQPVIEQVALRAREITDMVPV